MIARHPPPLMPANSARRALDIVGDRWTLLILRDAFLGVQQFHAWQARLGITPSVLTRRLKHLVEAGIFRRFRFRAVPPRVEYRLTEQGLDIYSVALMVLQWEQRWFSDAGQAITLRHARCGNVTTPRFVCGSCHGDVGARDASFEPGPGAGRVRGSDTRMRRPSITAADNRATHRFLEHVIDVLGDRWSWEIVGAMFLGCRRFDDIKAQTGMATNILSNRLRRLTAEGVLMRRAYQQRPTRHEYVLTPKGLDLYPATVMLVRWGDRWLAGNSGPPLLLFHKTCGGPLDAAVTCSSCDETLAAREVTYEFSGGEAAEPRPRAMS